MANPLYTALGGNTPQMGNMANMIKQFNQFRNSFKGSPKDIVMQMVNSGQLSQQQLNQLQQAAQQFQGLLK